MENMKSHSTLPAAMRIRGFTTTRHMKTIRSRQWDMNRENLDGETLSRFPLVQGEQIRWEN